MISGSTQNKDLTQKQIQFILTFSPVFINFTLPNIFLKSVGEGPQVLREIMTPISDKWSKKDWSEINAARAEIIQEISEAIKAHRQEIPRFVEELKSAQAEKTKLLAEQSKNPTAEINLQVLNQRITFLHLKTTDITEYDWAVFCKLVMQKEKILADVLEISVAMWIFLEKMKEWYQYYQESPLFKSARRGDEPVALFNKKPLRLCCDQFLGQLCQQQESGMASAEIIHNYLHLAYQVWREQKSKQKKDQKEKPFTKKDIAMTFAPGLFEGLGIFQEMLKTLPGEEMLSADAKMQKSLDLYNFYQLIVSAFMSKRFRKPFNKDFYLKITQPTYGDELQKAQARQTPRKRPSLASLMAVMGLSSEKTAEVAPEDSARRRSINLNQPLSPKSPRTPRVSASGETTAAAALTVPSMTTTQEFVVPTAPPVLNMSPTRRSPTRRHSKKGTAPSVSFALDITTLQSSADSPPAEFGSSSPLSPRGAGPLLSRGSGSGRKNVN